MFYFSKTLRRSIGAFALLSASYVSAGDARAATLLYQPKFEAPVGFVDTSGVDVSQ